MHERMVERSFPVDVADIVISLTKPRVNGIEILKPSDRRDAYAEVLGRIASPDALLVKMADRLHNLQTLEKISPTKRAKLVKETQQLYFPIFERAVNAYPAEGGKLLRQMQEIIDSIQAIHE